MIEPPERPRVFRKPYQFVLKIKEFNSLIKEFKELFKNYKNKWQCGGVSTKPVKYGQRFEIFVLAYAPGLCGNNDRGITHDEWSELINKMGKILDKYFKNIPFYAENWEEKEKFQIRVETYIAFEEMMD